MNTYSIENNCLFKQTTKTLFKLIFLENLITKIKLFSMNTFMNMNVFYLLINQILMFFHTFCRCFSTFTNF